MSDAADKDKLRSELSVINYGIHFFLRTIAVEMVTGFASRIDYFLCGQLGSPQDDGSQSKHSWSSLHPLIAAFIVSISHGHAYCFVFSSTASWC